MAIASQYIRGAKAVVKPSLTGLPYYLLIDGDTILYATKLGDFPTLAIDKTEAEGGDVDVVSTPVYSGERSVECDATAQTDSRADIGIIPFLFDVTYPYRIACKAYLTSLTSLYCGVSFVALRSAGDHLSGVGKWVSPERFVEADYAEGTTRIPHDFTLDTWLSIELIEVSDTQYYVEIDGSKYGPFTKRTAALPDETSYIGVWDITAKSSQLKLILDELKVYKPETSYDTAGAVAPTNVYNFWDDFETESGLSPFTVTTADGGTLARSTNLPYEGDYSMEVNTLGDVAKVAYLSAMLHPLRTRALDYPIFHETMFRLQEYDVLDGWNPIFEIYRGGARSMFINLFEYAGPPVHAGIRVCDDAGNHDDVCTIDLATWYKIAIKELNDTQFQLYVDDVLTPAGTTYTKIVSGLFNEWHYIGDGGDAQTAYLAYWDNMRWYRET